MLISFSYTLAYLALVSSVPLMAPGDDRPMREDRRNFAQTEDGIRYTALYLQEFGYIPQTVDLESKSNNELFKIIREPLLKFQRYHSLPLTGRIAWTPPKKLMTANFLSF